jgi:uncharacterized membrane protein
MLRWVIILLGLLPWLALGLVLLNPETPALAPLDSFFEVHCHRAPHRTLAFLGQRLPVCARCTGLYLGLLLGALLCHVRAERRWLVLCALGGGALLVLDVVTASAGLRDSTSTLRLVTGLGFAFPATWAALRGEARSESIAKMRI